MKKKTLGMIFIFAVAVIAFTFLYYKDRNEISHMQRISVEEIDEIKISMLYQGRQVSGNIIYPKDNPEGMGKIVDILNSTSSTTKKSINDVPHHDRVIKVELLPDKTVYLYQDGGKYYAETPYLSIAELTKEAYETILQEFGPIRPFPEDMDKTQFLTAVQDMLERYRSGNPPENPMEYKFDVAPKGIPLPYVNSADDFELEDGDGLECLYLAVIRFGEKDAYTIRMGLNQLTLGDETGWAVTSVYFSGPGIDADRTPGDT